MARFEMTKPQMSGIALGGIGTGSVELWPDGEFHFWQISNQSRWGGQCSQEQMDDGERHAGALSFWVRAEKEDGSPVVRKLGMKTDPTDFTYRMFAWNKPVKRIVYDGRFPVCKLTYEDDGLPCGVELTAVSPFAPGRLDLSAVPGFLMEYTLTNPTDRPLRVSLIGSLTPSFMSGGTVNRLVREEDVTAIHMASQVKNEDADCGEACLSVSGDGKETYLTADYFRFLKEFVAYSDYGVSQESFLFGFRETGRLPDTEAGTRPQDVPQDLTALTDREIDALAERLAAYPFARSFLERVGRVKPGFPRNRAEKEDFIVYCTAQKERTGGAFGSAALGKEVTVAPHASASVRFVFSWYFPNHFTPDGVKLGHYYETLCSDALAANRFLCAHPEAFEKAKAFSALLYRVDVPACYPDAWSVHLSTMVKSSWLVKDGRFGLWEGLGSCGFHTTDITYHASFGLVSLFPELQKRQMRMGAQFQREDGRVHHCFAPGLGKVDNGFERVDMNPQFCMLVCRDWLFTGDREYLAEMWPHVTRAMDAIEKLDADGDGLPDTDTRRNTYDAWNFRGTTAYISVLWLGALKASELIAREMGDGARAEKWHALMEKGAASFEEKLWNGSCYDLWCDGDEKDKCIMTDQLDGEWFLRTAGIGALLTDERVKTVLNTIINANYDAEDGLVNATCPGETTLHTWKNCQAEAVWTGIGYAFAALCLNAGMEGFAETEINKIHENQADLGLFWSHWECGAWYTRPMSSWSTLIALSGMKLNAKEKRLSLAPLMNGRLPLCMPDAVAEAEFSDEACVIRCIEGSLDGWTVTCDGRRVTVG